MKHDPEKYRKPKGKGKDSRTSSSPRRDSLEKRTPRTHEHGVHVVGAHFDDLFGGVDEIFSYVLAQLCNMFQLGSVQEGRFTYRGRQVVQHAEGSIEVDMAADRQS